MKKLISLLIAATMIAALAATFVVADGSILFSDNFDSGVFNEADWRVNGSLFEILPGGPTNSPHLEGWAEAVVQQTSYNDDENPTPAPRVYNASFAVKCDTWFYDDGGNDVDEHWVGLWWADHFEDQIGGDRIVYTVRCIYETRTVAIIVHGENGATDYFDDDTVLAEWHMPDDVELEMDASSPTVFNLGMRINGTQIDGFFNGQKVVSATAPIIHQHICPILFWNGGCWTGFDNFVVSTADYDLFGEGDAANAPAANDGAPATEKVIESETVLVTDAEGNTVVEVVTSEVARPAANTGAAATGGTAARTGDSAIVVIAVMIAAFGTAIAVKKFSSR